jgi:hypothetical protein
MEGRIIMPFALYEAGSEDETFIRVAVAQSYEDITTITQDRHVTRIENGDGPINERRTVPAQSTDELPLHANVAQLRKLIRSNNEMYP